MKSGIGPFFVNLSHVCNSKGFSHDATLTREERKSFMTELKRLRVLLACCDSNVDQYHTFVLAQTTQSLGATLIK